MTRYRPGSERGALASAPQRSVHLELLPDASSRPRGVLPVIPAPLALSVVADQVPVVTAVSVILAGVALLSSAATLVLASGVGCRVADQPAPAVTAVVAGIALEACV